jgi:tRNA(Ile)-lysidine synthase
MADAREHGRILPFVLIHVDHQVRPGSAGEAELVARLARETDSPFVRTVLERKALPSGLSEESWLRQRRYGALCDVVAKLGLDGVATAHTRDDQVETILMRLFTGAGTTAASGMRPIGLVDTPTGRLKVLRPLLAANRVELAAILEQRGIEPIHDPSNQDLRYKRNAIRHEIVPAISKVFPGFDNAVMRAVEIAARDGDLVDQLAAAEMSTARDVDGGDFAISRAWIKHAHPAMATRVIRMTALELMPPDARELSLERVEAVRIAAHGRAGASIQLPYGVVAHVEAAAVVFELAGKAV